MGAQLASQLPEFYQGQGGSMNTRVLVPDYGCGNLASVLRMCEKVGGSCNITGDPAALARADKIILGGVGAFDHGAGSLHDLGWVDALNEAVLQRCVPVLGICLGMQLMCGSSEEGSLSGLSWIDAAVRRFNLPADSALKIPHMGWNTISVVKPNSLVSMDDGEQRFYFVHSYHAVCNNPADVLATAHHGYDFTAAFCRKNIYGVQFHPEKSHSFGMALMKKFVNL